MTVTDIDQSIAFYSEVLGMEAITFAGGRRALRFGDQKINLHRAGQEIWPHAQKPTPGSTDLCFITETPLQDFTSSLTSCSVSILKGPLTRNGAAGSLHSIYINDPDGNLIEIANSLI